MDTRWNSRRSGRSSSLGIGQTIGANVLADGEIVFRVWAPGCNRVAVQWASPGTSSLQRYELHREDDGYFSARVPAAVVGDHYGFLLDDSDELLPDPASRFQPLGPLGPSEIIDPTTYRWTDERWEGVTLAGQVIYEMHVGTFTPEGTWRAAERELAELASAGITLIELMPIAGFPGRFNWGYDGVDLYAPCQSYGRPDDVRSFVDAAHKHGIGVLLDVVYNHLGPRGNFLKRYAPHYFTDRYHTDWGEPPNFDGPHCLPVREYFLNNAAYWIEEFHFDGLRIDATQDIHDSSEDHMLGALVREVRAAAAGRRVVVLAECEPQWAHLMRPVERGGFGFDGAWNDDFHHAATVAVRGQNEAYYSDYRGTAQELLSTCKYGYLFQGQRSGWQGKPRGTPALDLPPWMFVNYLENHDQLANSLAGARSRQLTSPGRYRAISSLLLLAPGTPLLFQGQEFGASSPFVFFADHPPELADRIATSRHEFLSQFPSMAPAEAQQHILPPAAEETFRRCKLNLGERQQHAPIYQMFKDLLRLRRDEAALRPRPGRWLDGAVLEREAFVLRYFGERPADERLLLANFGLTFALASLPEPLLAPPAGFRWAVRFFSEDPRYGGMSLAQMEMDATWSLPGHCLVWLYPQEESHHA